MQYIGSRETILSFGNGSIYGRVVADIIKWPVVLVCPGEDELTLLADLSARREVSIVAVIDPEGFSIGASLSEVMGLRIIRDLTELEPGSAQYLVHPPLDDLIAPIVDRAEEFGLKAVSARDFPKVMDDEDIIKSIFFL